MINTARSAVSQLAMSGYGSDPMVIRFMKGVYQMRPSQPRYSSTWDVSVVLAWLATLSPVRFLSLKQLTLKTVLLLALVFAARSQTLLLLDLDRMIRTKSTVEFSFPVNALKQSRPGYVPEKAIVSRYEGNRKVCPFGALLEYIKRTESLRGSESQLFISYCKPYKKVSSDSISRWIKTAMCQAGIDTSVFKAHSVRSASTSKAKNVDLPIEAILKTAGWTRASTFAKFYHKTVPKVGTSQSEFQEAVLG